MFRTHHRRPSAPAARIRAQLGLESLEDRCLLSGTVLQTNLVSDLPGVAAQLDPNLVNPWGISESSGSPFWVSDNNAGVSTLYNSTGTPQSLVVSIPTPVDALGAAGTPTGTVFNIDGGKTGGFQISGLSKTGTPATASAVFLFATEDGTIVGWNPGVNPTGFATAKAGTYGTLAVDNSGNNFTEPDPNKETGAVYKGLAIATDANGRTLLYAANFRSGQIDVFDTNFKPVTTLGAGAFTDPKLPKGYAPFDVQTLGNQIYVTYAKQDAAKHDDVSGPGNGFVDVYNLDGSGEQRLISRGSLDSPWGLAIAPASFGSLAGSLLVGNFGNGHINAFDPSNGTFLGGLTDPDGEPIAIDGLWGLHVGNGGNGGDANTVYFTAGLFGETHGLFGSLAPVAPGTPEGPAEAQMVQAALDVFQADLTTVEQDFAMGVSGATLKQDLQNLHTAFVDLIQAEVHFAHDQFRDSHGKGGGPDGAHDHDMGDLDDIFGDHGDSGHDHD
jgi:uncharacterized protein (TIGR03118 family)